jgi:hypothetical protein
MTYTNCRHTIWICNPSNATVIAAAGIIAAGVAIVRAGLVVVIVVAVSLLFNFCVHVYLALAWL